MLKKVAVIDKTGRGHSICDAFIRTNSRVKVFYIPGTGGVFHDRIEVIPNIDVIDGISIGNFCKKKRC